MIKFRWGIRRVFLILRAVGYSKGLPITVVKTQKRKLHLFQLEFDHFRKGMRNDGIQFPMKLL